MNSQSRTRKTRRGQFGGNLARVVFTAVMLAMLLMPLTGTGVGAEKIKQVDPTILTDQPVVLDPSIVNPVVQDPSVIDTDPPTPDATLDLQAIPSLEVIPNLTPEIYDPSIYPSSLYINPVLCPYDLDLNSVDYYGLALNCQGGFANGYELHVQTTSNVPIWQQVIQDGGVNIPSINQDTYSIDFTAPASGGSNLRIICSADDTLGNDAIPFADLTVDQFGGDLYVEGNLMYFCDVFIQEDGPYVPAADDMTVYINKHGCPQGIVSDDEYFLASECQDMLDGIDFNLTDANGTTTQTTTGTPAMATFTGVNGSSLAISEVIPGGYQNPAVFCNVEDDLGNDLLQAILNPTVDQGAFTIDNIPADAGMIFCDVFNFPTDADGGSIIILKYECPANYDFTSSDPTADCGSLLNGVQFNTSGPNGYAAQTNTGDSIYGAVMFGGLEAGEYSVVETLPSNMTEAWLWNCTSDVVDLSGMTPEDHSDGSAFVYDLQDNEDIVCRVYNAPSDTGTVTVHKWECPSSYDASHDLAWYQTNCVDPMAGVDFSVVNNNTSTSDTYTTDANGDLSFSYDTSDNDTLYEEIPSGYTDPVFYCTWSGIYDIGNPTLTVTDGVIQGVDTPTNRADLPSNYWGLHMECDFYNNPTEHGTVTVHKWECPEAYDASHDLNWYQTNCTQAMENVEFKLVNNDTNGSHLYYTDANGDLSFTVKYGHTYFLYETVPAGYSDPVVYCKWGGYSTDNQGNPLAIDGVIQRIDTPQNQIDWDTNYSHFGMDCNWYNNPTDWQNVTVYKYTCPAGYDLSDPQNDCTYLTDDVDFHLLPDGQPQLDGTTGDAGNGAVQFSNVPSGDFKLWETVPSGTTAAYVTCQWFDNYGPYVYQQYADLVAWDGAPIDNSIDFTLAQGDEIVCQWYNVPTKTWSGGDLTIYKYWCTGYIVSDDNCELGSGVKFAIKKADGSGSPILTETGPGGFVDVSGIDAGSYAVSEKDFTWCKAVSSKVDAEGNVVVEDGQETILTVYNCIPPTKKEATPVVVTKFPNTGAGTVQHSSDDEMILLAAAGFFALMVLGFAVRMQRSAIAVQVRRLG